jgi:hypothetical protein
VRGSDCSEDLEREQVILPLVSKRYVHDLLGESVGQIQGGANLTGFRVREYEVVVN